MRIGLEINMKRSLLIILIILLLVVPFISADEPKKLFFFPTQELYNNIDYDSALSYSLNNPESSIRRNQILIDLGYSGGFREPVIQSSLENDEGPATNLALKELAFEVLAREQSIGLEATTNLKVEVVISKDPLDLNSVGQDPEESRNNIQKALEEKGFDPGKDQSVLFFSDLIDAGGRTFPFNFEPIEISASKSSFDTLAHELHHNGFIDGEFHCDHYTYESWNIQNQYLIKKYDKGCARDYDPLECCIDNPRWYDGQGKFLRVNYLDHINSEEIDIGVNCLPKDLPTEKSAALSCEYDKETMLTTAGTDIMYSIFGGFCSGNPCQADDPHPPYKRSLMTSDSPIDTGKSCFEGGVERISPAKEECGGTLSSTTQSPSQQK